MAKANPSQSRESDFVGRCVQLAIELECSSIKAGNVHPGAAFHDLNHEHFMRAAHAIGQAMESTILEPLGVTVLRCVDAMMASAKTNTSLGTVLLLAPLVKSKCQTSAPVSCERHWKDSLQAVLANLSDHDSNDIYQAIRLAKPGGLGQSEQMDVTGPAPTSIMEAMRIASSWDDVALQYATGFELVFQISDRLSTYRREGADWPASIRRLQIELLSERRDSLIARKLGGRIADQVREQATSVMESGAYGSPNYEAKWTEFDGYLRDDGHKKNPGTIADLLAAGIFVSLMNEPA